MYKGRTKNYPVIDAHCHLGAVAGGAFLGEDLIGMMDKAGVDKAIVFPIPSALSFSGGKGTIRNNYYNTNDYIAEMQDKYPERIIGFAGIDPRYTGNQELGMSNLTIIELERCIKKLKLKGIKIHPVQHWFYIDSLAESEFMNTVTRLQKEMNVKIPILSHGMTEITCTPAQFGTLASKHPEVLIIIAHGGWHNTYSSPMTVVKEYKNLFTDTACNLLDSSALRVVAKTVGVNKVIFGSDHFSRDHENLYESYFHMIGRIFPDSEERELVLGGNIAEILGLPAT